TRERSPQHFLVQKPQRARRLVLRGRAHPGLGQTGEESLDLGLAELRRMTQARKPHEAAHPRIAWRTSVSSFGPGPRVISYPTCPDPTATHREHARIIIPPHYRRVQLVPFPLSPFPFPLSRFPSPALTSPYSATEARRGAAAGAPVPPAPPSTPVLRDLAPRPSRTPAAAALPRSDARTDGGTPLPTRGRSRRTAPTRAGRRSRRAAAESCNGARWRSAST